MQSVIELLPVTPSIDQLSRIIGNVAAPACLGDEDEPRSYLKADLPRLKRRAQLLNRALLCSVVAAILTALIIIVAFISAMMSVAHEYGVAILFIGALLLFCAALVDLARETRIALHDNDLRM